MKKYIIVTLAILAILCSVLALAACEHKHDYVWIDEVEATCEREGTVGHYHCDECGKNFDKSYKELETVAVAKISHTWDDGVVTPATCETDGETLYTCTVCGDTKTDVINAIGHDWDAGVIVVQPTCSSLGTIEQSCRNCKETHRETVDMLDHTPELIPAVAPTCETAGNTAGERCAACGLVLVEANYVAPLGHTFGEWETLISATDDHSGLEIRTCTVCRNKSETRDVGKKEHVWGDWVYGGDGTHTRTCQNSDCENRVDTQSCVYNSGNVVAATCTSGGYTTYTCQLCGNETESEKTDALGHNYGDFTADFVGVEDFDNHKHTHTRVCKRCGDTDTQDCADTIEAVIVPTCTTGGYTTYTCNTCGSVHETDPIQAFGHSFGQWTYEADDTHTQTCQTCSTVEKQSCVYDALITLPTCTDGGYTTHVCSICEHYYKDTETDAYGHAFSDWQYDGDGVTHTHTHVCSRCQISQTQACEMVEVTLAETCTTDGSITETCKYCLISFTEAGAKSLGHDFNDFVDGGNGNHTRSCKRCDVVDSQPHAYEMSTVSDADCDNARVVKNVCSVCSSWYSESVGQALGHSWGDWTASDDKHTHVCLRNGDHVEEFIHGYTDTNLCDDCGYDSLIYKLQGGHYVVYSDNRVPASVTTIIIAAKHGEVGQANLYDVTQIGESAFRYNRSITGVVLPATVTTISDYAFYNCSALTSVTIESGSQLVEIAACAFAYCGALESLNLPDGLVTIGSYAFANSTKLFEIDVPAGLQSLGSNAFYNTACYNDVNRWTDGVLYMGKHLVKAQSEVSGEYTVKDGTVSIGYMAFSQCVSLTDINLPSSLKYVDSNAFLGCEALASVKYAGTMDDWFAISFVNDASSPLYHAARLNIELATGDVVIPDGITSIPAGTFRGTAITSVYVPDSVTFIGEEAFENCENLTEITIPDSVKYIGANAFVGSAYYLDATKWQGGALYVGNHLIATKPEMMVGDYTVKAGTITIGIDAFKNCVSLTSVTIPSTVVRIGANAFAGCTALRSIVFEDSTLQWFANRVDSISRLLSAKDLATSANVPELFEFYNGEWKRWN